MTLLQIRDHFLNWLDKHDRKRVIMDRTDNAPYLERYYLFLNTREYFPFNIFLHRFLRGDPDDVHDHPWPYATFILAGGYYEWVPIWHNGMMVGETRLWRGPGHFRVCKPTSYHRIELKEGITAWTLFMPGPHRREWGFLVNNKWIPNGKYLSTRKSN